MVSDERTTLGTENVAELFCLETSAAHFEVSSVQSAPIFETTVCFYRASANNVEQILLYLVKLLRVEGAKHGLHYIPPL